MSAQEKITDIINVWNGANKIIAPTVDIEPGKLVDQVAHFFSAGNYFYYVFNFATLKMDFVHENVYSMTGIKAKDLSLESMLSIYHPTDLDHMQEKEAAALNFLLNKITPEQLPHYKVVYLIRYLLKNGTVKHILHQAKTINVSEDGKIQQVIGVHTDVTHLQTKIDNTISFVSDIYPSYYAVDPANPSLDELKNEKKYTKRELEIIHLIALGNSSKEIAAQIHVSINTVESHRRNILNKSGAPNIVAFIAQAIREGII